MQGLAFVHHRPLAGIPALEALALLGGDGLADGSIVAPWIDAHRREVFTALYRVTYAPLDGVAGLPQVVEIEGATVGAPDVTLRRWLENGIRAGAFIGDGAVLYCDTIAHAMPAGRILPAPPLAGAVGRLAAAGLHGTGAGPAAIQPLYVRRPDVEIARDEKLR
jgi:tRNA A37 threonylcarbamoyladenosine modification protein TsaB